jgi:orotidine-5'-phosphate decarboxylase
MYTARNKIIIALDDMKRDEALSLVVETKDFAATYKVGLSLFTAYGPELLRDIKALGADIFLDLKFHDIPMQVEKAIAAALKYEPKFLTIHALGGKKMMEAAALACAGSKTRLLAVSVLTSMDQKAWETVGFSQKIEDSVTNLLELAHSSGVKGFVLSPLELEAVRKRFKSDCFLVSPGVRPSGAELHDQSRVSTVREAIQAGADCIVIGRPVSKALDSRNAAKCLHEEVFMASEDQSISESYV